MTLVPVLAGAGLLATSGFASMLARTSRRRDLLFATMMVIGGVVGSVGAIGALVMDVRAGLAVEWPLPWGRVWLHLDALGAAFLLPVFVVPALGAVYSVAYWSEDHNPSARSLRVFYGLLAGSMALVVLAKDGVFFLMAWEVMALSAFFCVATEDRKPEVRRAAWVYFVAAHIGTLALFALFALLRSVSGGFELSPLNAESLPARTADWVFLLALTGFGFKAGVMPLHVWLPGAHANAPSHVSAVLSGVMLNMGLYGMFRVCSLVHEVPAWWGWLLVGLGAASAVLGIAFAVGQHDYKRLLAYSSIENIGVITLGFGAALLGRALHDPALTGLALAGAMLHVWNHALFKSLLFLVAGSVLHATGTRRMNLLGGLARTMPWTAALACLGCIAIGAMPPLNGFVSEWLIYRALLGRVGAPSGGLSAPFAGAVTALALTGALAIVAFVRLFAITFLGAPRSQGAGAPREAPPVMLVPAFILIALCMGVAVLPLVTTSALAPVVRLAGTEAAAQALLRSGMLDPLRLIGVTSACVLAAGIAAGFLFRRWTRAASAPRAGTWDCGYARPSARMQYGESSMAQLVVGLFAGVLLPRRRAPHIDSPFPAPTSHRTEVPDALLDRAALPGLRALARLTTRLRLLQPGKVQVYMLYILLAVLVLLVLVVP